jgi:hypothetical protein
MRARRSRRWRDRRLIVFLDKLPTDLPRRLRVSLRTIALTIYIIQSGGDLRVLTLPRGTGPEIVAQGADGGHVEILADEHPHGW